VAALRTTLQLLLIGLVLRAVFENVHWGWITLIAAFMLVAAGREVMARQKRRLRGGWGFGVGALSMFLSSFTVTVLALIVIIGGDPWYAPQYAIPLLGMLLGNTMNGISLGMGRLTESAWQQKAVLEQRLLLGHSRQEAISDLHRDAVRTGLIPIINAMAAAGMDHRPSAVRRPAPPEARTTRVAAFLGPLPASAHSRTRMLLGSQIALSSLGQTVTLTSPRCAARSRYM
jgi:putative ABC transport system permease protein